MRVTSVFLAFLVRFGGQSLIAKYRFARPFQSRAHARASASVCRTAVTKGGLFSFWDRGPRPLWDRASTRATAVVSAERGRRPRRAARALPHQVARWRRV